MTLKGVSVKGAAAGQGAAAEAPTVTVEGTAEPNAEVVVENKSLAPFSPLGSTDAFVRARADQHGAFSVTLPAAREGDRVVIQSGTSAMHTRLSNVEAVDGRRPTVRQQGIRLVAEGERFRFTNASENDVIGEPEQDLVLTNRRTGVVTTITLDGDGRIPAEARLEGQPGDAWAVATSDGVHQVNSGCGALLAPPADPLAEPTTSMLTTERTTLEPLEGPLFVGGPDGSTIKQGQIGDCWLVAACDAIVRNNPARIRDIMRDNHDGTYTVTLQRFDRDAGRYVADEVTVTNRIHHSGGRPLYGRSSAGDVWFPILEKAYAKWKGGYDGVRSGYPFEAYEAILGAAGKHYDFDVAGQEAVWRVLQKGVRAKDAMVTWTRVDTPVLRFANTGLVGDHAFIVLDCFEREGQRMVRVRNPWGSNAYGSTPNPLGIVKKDDVLEVPLSVFARYFGGLGAVATQRSGDV